jgi:sulfonate transport system substrate-binding protein
MMDLNRRTLLSSCLAGAAAVGLRGTAFAEAGGNISLGILRNVPGTLISVADEKGIFKSAGVELEMAGKFLSGGGPALLPAVASGSVDVCVIGDTPVILGLGSGGLDAEVLAVVSETSKVFSVVGSQGIETLTDLKGKTVGFPLGTAFEYFFARALQTVGMSMSDVQVTKLSQAEALPAFAAGHIDAVLPDTFGRPAMIKARPGSNIIFSSDTGFDNSTPEKSFRQFNIFVANASAATEKKAAIQAFLKTYYSDVTLLLRDSAQHAATVTAMTALLNGSAKGALAEADVDNQISLSGFPSLEEAKQIQKNVLGAALTAQAEFWKSSGKIAVMPDFSKLSDGMLL